MEIAKACHLSGDFFLRSGRRSTFYFDKYQFEGQPDVLSRVAQKMLSLLPPRTECLAAMEMGGIPIGTAMSLQSGLPLAFVRKQAKEYGTGRAVEGPPVGGAQVVIVEDVITTGGAISTAIAHLAAVEAEILAVTCAIWRGEGQPILASSPNVPVFAAFTVGDLEPGAVSAVGRVAG